MDLEFRQGKFPWDVCSELFSEFLRSFNGSRGLRSEPGDLSVVPGTQVKVGEEKWLYNAVL